MKYILLFFMFLISSAYSQQDALQVTDAYSDNSGGANTIPSKAGTEDVNINPEARFHCGHPFVDGRDGKSYNTILIGRQCWMAQNLNYSEHDAYTSGAADQTNNGIIEKYCYFDNPSNGTAFGGLYQWAEAVQYINGASNTTPMSSAPAVNVQGVCPSGWHIPTDAEWCTMENAVEAGTDADFSLTGWRGSNTGGLLKQTDTAFWRAPNTGGVNSSGFSALPGGGRFAGGAFNYVDSFGFWWTATEANAANARYHALSFNKSQTARNCYNKSYGFHVRCVKD